jgi:hypothetical protein
VHNSRSEPRFSLPSCRSVYSHDLSAPCTSDGSPVTAAATGRPCLQSCCASNGPRWHGDPARAGLRSISASRRSCASASQRYARTGPVPAVRRESRIDKTWRLPSHKQEDDAMNMATATGEQGSQGWSVLRRAGFSSASPGTDPLKRGQTLLLLHLTTTAHLSLDSHPCLLFASKQKGG